MMPLSENFTCHKIAVDFFLADGSKETIETRVIEKIRAQEQFEDSMADGSTAVLATLPAIESNFRYHMMRISLGNMPPQATAHLRAFCNQKLELEDESYCYRLPFTYVPAYLGNVSNMVSLQQMQEGAQQDPSIQEVLEV